MMKGRSWRGPSAELGWEFPNFGAALIWSTYIYIYREYMIRNIWYVVYGIWNMAWGIWGYPKNTHGVASFVPDFMLCGVLHLHVRVTHVCVHAHVFILYVYMYREREIQSCRDEPYFLQKM